MLTINGVSQYKSHFLLSNIEVFTAPPPARYGRHLCCSQSPSLPPPGPDFASQFQCPGRSLPKTFQECLLFCKELSFHFFFDNNFAQKLSTRTNYVIGGAQYENGNSRLLKNFKMKPSMGPSKFRAPCYLPDSWLQD